MSANKLSTVLVAGWLVGWDVSVALGDAPEADQFAERVAEYGPAAALVSRASDP